MGESKIRIHHGAARVRGLPSCSHLRSVVRREPIHAFRQGQILGAFSKSSPGRKQALPAAIFRRPEAFRRERTRLSAGQIPVIAWGQPIPGCQPDLRKSDIGHNRFCLSCGRLEGAHAEPRQALVSTRSPRYPDCPEVTSVTGVRAGRTVRHASVRTLASVQSIRWRRGRFCSATYQTSTRWGSQSPS